MFNDNTSLLRLGVYNGALNEQGRITGFVPGDTIAVYSSQSTLTGVTYQAVSGGLGTLAIRSGAATVSSLTLAGNDSGYAFKLNQPFSNSYEVTAVAPAAPANAFLTTDTFLVDGRAGGGVTWSTVVNFHRGDAVTIFGFPGTSTRPWTAVDGANGYQGATIHSELGGAGTGVNDSVTFAGVSLADAQNKFTISQGTVGDTPYLYVAYTG